MQYFEPIVLEIPLQKEYITTLRLTVGGYCALTDATANVIEDVKLCAQEAALLLMRNGYRRAKLHIQMQETLHIHMTAEGEKLSCADETAATENEFSILIIDALSDNFENKENESDIDFSI